MKFDIGQWNRDMDRLENFVVGTPRRLADEAEEIVQETITEGADAMRTYIETSGLGDKTGRIETGYMLGDVTQSEVTNNGTRIEGSWGWGVTHADVKDYYLYQEQGFTHARSGKDIPPMHALLRSYIDQRDKFYSRIFALVGR